MVGPSLAFRNVSVTLGGQDIVSDVSFDLAAGAVHGLVGPNGGGKTTLIRALLGQTPFTGTIGIDGPKEAVIGYAPQSLDLDRTLPFTVLDVLAVMNQRKPVFLGRSKHNARDLDAVIEKVGLTSKARRLFGALSGGERQRLLLAQALFPAPDLLLLDEPTSNMDEAGARLVEGVVAELCAAGVTIIWISHDWDQIRRLASTATIISRKLVAHGPPRDVLTLEAAR